MISLPLKSRIESLPMNDDDVYLDYDKGYYKTIFYVDLWKYIETLERLLSETEGFKGYQKHVYLYDGESY